MLISFSVENYLSIRDRATLSMETVPDKGSKNSIYPENYQTLSLKEKTTKEFKILKSAIIYGANASGKTNLVIALKRCANFIVESYMRGDEDIPVDPFLLNTQTRNEPTTFEIELLLDGVYYRYGYVTDSKVIHKEWLYSSSKGRESTIIARERNNVSNEYNFYNSKYKRLHKDVRENSLLLTHAALSNEAIPKLLLIYFKNIRFHNNGEKSIPKDINKPLLQEFTKKIDIGLSELQYTKKNPDVIEKIINDLTGKVDGSPLPDKLIQNLQKKLEEDEDITFLYKDNSDELISLHEGTQSTGTLAILSLLAKLFNGMNDAGIILVDEIEESLHPHLLSYFFKFFHAIPNNKLQIITTTHNPLLLDEGFRRDQIYFTEKGYDNATVLSSASEFTGIRAKKSLLSLYLSGGFGAIPNISDVSFDKIINVLTNPE